MDETQSGNRAVLKFVKMLSGRWATVHIVPGENEQAEQYNTFFTYSNETKIKMQAQLACFLESAGDNEFYISEPENFPSIFFHIRYLAENEAEKTAAAIGITPDDPAPLHEIIVVDTLAALPDARRSVIIQVFRKLCQKWDSDPAVDYQRQIEIMVSGIDSRGEIADGPYSEIFRELEAEKKRELEAEKNPLNISAVKDFVYPVDKMDSMALWDAERSAPVDGELQTLLPIREKELAKNKAGKRYSRPIVHNLMIYYGELPPEIERRLTPKEKLVCWAAISCYWAGNQKYCTVHELARAMGKTGGGLKENEIAELSATLTKLRLIPITYKKKQQRYLLPVNLSFSAEQGYHTVNGHIVYDVIEWLEKPALLELVEQSGEYQPTPLEAMQIPGFRRTNSNAAVLDYLLERVSRMMGPREKHRSILFSNGDDDKRDIYTVAGCTPGQVRDIIAREETKIKGEAKACGDPFTPKTEVQIKRRISREQQLTRDTVYKILDYWTDIHFIAGYQKRNGYTPLTGNEKRTSPDRVFIFLHGEQPPELAARGK